MVEGRVRYADHRPYTVPETLTELTGPTGGVVTLPNHLDWSELHAYDVDDPAELGMMYEIVIREALDVDDLRHYLNGGIIRVVWHQLFLPPRVRTLWEARFPDLAAAA